MNSPLVSVIMPVYNGALYLKEAVESILEQSLTEFELIIIDDGSKDDSATIAKSFTDPRIRFIQNEKNKGLSGTLNSGIKESLGTYVARMDQDDVAVKNRLEAQVTFLKANPDVGICGSDFRCFGVVTPSVVAYPTNPDQIFADLLFYNCLAHPTIMFNRVLFEKYCLLYDPEFEWAEDFAMWTKARAYFKISNVPQVLLNYRINSASMTNSGQVRMWGTMKRIYQRSLQELDIETNEELLTLHLYVGNRLPLENFDALVNAGTHLKNILDHNDSLGIYNNVCLEKAVKRIWLPAFENLINEKKQASSFFYTSELSRRLQIKQISSFVYIVRKVINRIKR